MVFNKHSGVLGCEQRLGEGSRGRKATVSGGVNLALRVRQYAELGGRSGLSTHLQV